MRKLTPLQTLMATATILGAEGMRDYHERAQAGETNDDDCELYGHGEDEGCVTCPDCGKNHRATYHVEEPCNECCEKLAANSETMNRHTTPGRDEPPHREGPHDDQCEFRRVKTNRCGCYSRRMESQRDADEDADEQRDRSALNA